jgi:hypothetical protein
VDGSYVVKAGKTYKVGRWRLKPVSARTERDALRLGSLTQRPCVIRCDNDTCYSIESAYFQRFKLKRDAPLSNLAFRVNLRRYNKVPATDMDALKSSLMGLFEKRRARSFFIFVQVRPDRCCSLQSSNALQTLVS